MTRPSASALLCLLVWPALLAAQDAVSWTEIQGIPTGSEVTVTLREGQSRTGTVTSVEDGRLTLTRTSTVERYARDHVANVAVRKMARSFMADGSPNPVHVRHVVNAIAVGSKVKVRTIAGRRLTGKIQSIDAERFSVIDGRLGTQVIAFAEVDQIRPASSGLALGLVIGGIVFGLLLLNGWNAAN